MGPARFHCATLLSSTEDCQQTANRLPPAEKMEKYDERVKKLLSEVGFEPTPTEVDCDLNAAP